MVENAIVRPAVKDSCGHLPFELITHLGHHHTHRIQNGGDKIHRNFCYTKVAMDFFPHHFGFSMLVFLMLEFSNQWNNLEMPWEERRFRKLRHVCAIAFFIVLSVFVFFFWQCQPFTFIWKNLKICTANKCSQSLKRSSYVSDSLMFAVQICNTSVVNYSLHAPVYTNFTADFKISPRLSSKVTIGLPTWKAPVTKAILRDIRQISHMTVLGISVNGPTEAFCPLRCILFDCSGSCFNKFGRIDWVGWRSHGEDGRGCMNKNTARDPPFRIPNRAVARHLNTCQF